ncbi:unnamed protein product [Adineta steineri]|uniref:Alpha-mannosidase n=1 Tax=Adineta steineri TaxID=433720 RepID=A0A818TJ24_9BILA|nr:unnamed protein product [Adineta steineri]
MRQKSKQQKINEHLDDIQDSIRDINKAFKEVSRKQKQQLILPQKLEAIHQIPKIKLITQPNLNQNSTISSKFEQINTQCTWRTSSPTNTSFEIRQLYDSLPFDNQNGGVWGQGFDIQYNTSQWTPDNKLKIILMPHSHCDPGWLNTFEQYFMYGTRHIMNNMIQTLEKNKNYKFIWAEMSFLSLWWDQATIQQQQLLKKLISNKQFEIVTGGWVMNDEANTHYFSMLDQLIEGHQFIEHKIGNISIKSSWANDPFGYSPTMAYLLQGSGIQHLAIQRVHYHIKKALAKEKQLEFLWQQTWDRSTSTRLFTHVLPFYAYDIPHTCGPDPKICCQFDFKRSADSSTACSWGINPVAINDNNIQERAELLLDQYRKKAQLYRTNTLFVQLGDDFRYRMMYEVRAQFGNYDKLLTYMNRRTDWNVDIQYGTLSDYFEKVLQEKSLQDFPSYVGDFFTYADHDDNYWSGYFTSRAFFKRMDRIAESYLRATEILFSIAHVKSLQEKTFNSFPTNDLFMSLIQARRNLGIFQHHDGITGTARAHVVNDYGRKLLAIIKISEIVMQHSAAYLLFQNNYYFNTQYLVLSQDFPTYESLPIRRMLTFMKGQQSNHIIYIYNPTDRKRIELVKIFINIYQVYVTSNKKYIDKCQIDPKWSSRRSNTIEDNQFELLIQVDIEPYTIREYTIHMTTAQEICPITKIEYITEEEVPDSTTPFVKRVIKTKLIEINNRFLGIIFSKTGDILSLQHKISDEHIRFHSNIIQYGTSKQSDRHSGAYLFIPNGNAQDIPTNNYNLIRVQRGRLINRIDFIHDMYIMQYRLTDTKGLNDYTLELSVTTHLNMKKDTELALRFSTGIKNGADFFTDLNGFQMIRRKTYDKLPLQGNVYPMPTMAYIEDDRMRFTILASQPSGVTCLKPGIIDVFLDRRLTRDDGRGLGEGVMDNRETISTFKILFEPRRTVLMADRTSLTGYPTLLAHHLSIELLYPTHIFHSLIPESTLHTLNLFLKPLFLPSDYHLVNLRTLNDNNNDKKYSSSKNLALILRRFAYDCDESYDSLFYSEQVRFEHLFSSDQIESIEQTSLSLRHIKEKLNITSQLVVPFAELVTYKIRFM